MIIRVFPRETNATPEDDYSFIRFPEGGLNSYVKNNRDKLNEVEEIRISVTFSRDIEIAEKLFVAWNNIKIAPVKIGGPAMGDPGGEFEPGLYLKKGYVITSRGCPNKCWFCDVHKREGGIREIAIKNGWNLLDSNILACSYNHIEKVFKMLREYSGKVELTGGLEAARLTDRHVLMLWDLKPNQMFFAYDTPDDLDPLVEAGKKLRYANFTRKHLRCYVLIGYPRDTIEDAKKRLLQTWDAGFMPMAMLWKNKKWEEDPEWRRFQRVWVRPAIIKKEVNKLYKAAITCTGDFSA